MSCPFPGMDSYLERAAIWPDFHDRFVACLVGLLQPQLRPRYVALTQDRLYVVESERPIRPDVSIVQTHPENRASAVAVLEADAPAVVFDLLREDVRETLIHIIGPAAGHRVVTAIEVLSPMNKAPGAGRTSYLRKRDELWEHGANLVEIDLLRAGEPTVRLSAEKLAKLTNGHYLVAVTRQDPSRQEVYAVPLQKRLPTIAVPLSLEDRDVALDLQAALTRCWNEGPYPELLKYSEAPAGNFSESETRWCEDQLPQAGLR